jgi:phenylalanyl-tRNA synthetase beta chain
MLVSWQWLNDYVNLSLPPEELAERFAMSGLNHEQTLVVDGDPVLDLEVTSNRGDCLGHIGVAREAAVLLGQALCVPHPRPAESAVHAAQSISVENLFPEGCLQYQARVIRGVKIGPSPQWLVQRLKAVGMKSVNNVVDVTNYVMMETGQPLHAFDLKHIRGGKIIVRPARPAEQFLAIDHHTYELDDRMVVIADAERPVALGGVMGGKESEITASTTDLLIEAALFQPLSIRRTARKLKLHSPSSFRFERRPDPAGLDWTSRRCCELILSVAGGVLEAGVVAVGEQPGPPPPIRLRLPQIPRVLGIDVPLDTVTRILTSLGCQINAEENSCLSVVAPSWRADLSREIDLIEEIARIYGYDKIPENAVVPMTVSQPRRKDTALVRIRHVLSSFGVDEAMTPSVVSERLEALGSLWTDQPPMQTETPLLEGAKLLRRSLLPSLLAARYANQTQSIRDAQLYEVANIVLPDADPEKLPREMSALAIITTADLRLIKGAVQTIIDQLGYHHLVNWSDADSPLFAPGAAQALVVDGQALGWSGIIHPRLQEQFHLDAPCAAAELNLDLLTHLLREVRTAAPYSLYPCIERDLNFIVDEQVRWSDLEKTCRAQGGQHLQRIEYRETYRDPKKDGANKKRILLSLHFQSMQRTLTSEEVEQSVAAVIGACQKEWAASLLA